MSLARFELEFGFAGKGGGGGGGFGAWWLSIGKEKIVIVIVGLFC